MNIKIEKGIPHPIDHKKPLIDLILSMEDGDSIYISYQDFTRTDASNCIANARARILSKGMSLKTVGDANGKRVWAFKFKNK